MKIGKNIWKISLTRSKIKTTYKNAEVYLTYNNDNDSKVQIKPV